VIEEGPSEVSGVRGEAECPRSHDDWEFYPCEECGADV
jgi:hypothetical protein